MTGWLLAISRDTQLGDALACAAVRKGRSYPFWAVATVDDARRLLGEHGSLPVLIVIDELFLRKEPFGSVVEEFACYAPLIVIGRSVHQAQLAAGVAEGKIDFVLRDDCCIPLVAALVERTLRWESDVDEQVRLTERRRLDRREQEREPDKDGFPEQALRQLGAILDSLEVVLAKRKLLPTAVVRRLGRAADLAFDLEDGVRLLAGYPLRQADSDPDAELSASI